MSTLILHPQDQSTDFLKPIYATIPNKTVIRGGIGKNKLRRLIKKHDRIIMLGHGTPIGLLSVGQFPTKVGSYIVDYSYSDLLSEKSENIFIWCFADQFVNRNGLNGFFSGMFISEFQEAFSWGFYISDRNLIKESNEYFSSIVSRNIHQPLNVLYQNVIQEYGELAKTNQIAKFNLERLYLNSNHKNNGSIVFVRNYESYLDEIGEVVKPELLSILDELRQIDPHDLVRPDSWFQNEAEARGFVWSMFIKRVTKSKFNRNGSLES